MNEHLREARNVWSQGKWSHAVHNILQHLEAQESAPLTEEYVPIVDPQPYLQINDDVRVLVERSIHDKLDRILKTLSGLAWVASQPAQAVGVTTVPGDVGE